MQRCLNGKTINIDHFLNEHRSPVAFPWDLVGLSRPVAGTLHGYLGRALAPFCKHPIEKNVLAGNPLYSQIQLIAQAMNQADPLGLSMSEFIVRWCDGADKDKTSRLTLEQKVVSILKNCPEFVANFEKEITRLWISGVINLSDVYFQEPRKKSDSKGWF